MTLRGGQRAVLKPQAGERPGLRNSIAVGTYWRREVAAYRIDQTLEFFLVPTTIAREAEGMFGSFQAFVDGDDGLGVDAYASSDRQMMAAFDYLIGNTDRNASNWLTQHDGRPAAIDNGLAFPTAMTDALSSPWVVPMLGQPFEESVARRIRVAAADACVETLQECEIEGPAVDLFRARLAELQIVTLLGRAGGLAP